MGEIVTGPGAAKVWTSPRLRTFAYGFRYDWNHYGDPMYNDVRPEVFRWSGHRETRRAINKWNRRAETELFRSVQNKAKADVQVKPSQGQTGNFAVGTGTYPRPGYEEVRIDKKTLASGAGPTVIAHELGHTQGLKHKHQSPKPGIMRYEGDPGGRTLRPTAAEAQRVEKMQSQRSSGSDPQGGGGASKPTTKPKKKKPSKPAHERKVTGSHKVMQ